MFDKETRKKIWATVVHWSRGLRTYVGVGLTMWVSPAVRDANVNIEIGPVCLPVAQLVDIIGGMLMGVGGVGKISAYKQAKAQDVDTMTALSRATLQGPILGPIREGVSDAMGKLRGNKNPQ